MTPISKQLSIDEHGNLWQGSGLCTDPCQFGFRCHGVQRKNLTGATVTDYYRGSTRLTRITEKDGRIWFNLDDGERLTTLSDIDKVRKEVRKEQRSSLFNEAC